MTLEEVHPSDVSRLVGRKVKWPRKMSTAGNITHQSFILFLPDCNSCTLQYFDFTEYRRWLKANEVIVVQAHSQPESVTTANSNDWSSVLKGESVPTIEGIRPNSLLLVEVSKTGIVEKMWVGAKEISERMK